MIGVSFVDPGGDLVSDRRFIGDASIEASRGEDAEFGLAKLSQEPCLGV